MNEKEARTFITFFSIYCENKHLEKEKKSVTFKNFGANKEIFLCEECELLATSTLLNRISCPKNPKPSCRKCPDNCHGPDVKSKVRKVMMYSSLRRLLKKT
ncbi:nitrous oxide-stimulated promoter family protein [Alkalicella caledoniensis]|uniref:Nitrous oxide-stimulated promoter family protein n=1 Tax=Alkalicella caledoniensis TaxID=2731377 RepID=A0A7G9W7F7_ALKCA|nr:nitrous oxide-stimulated promoter family protein [Alkalicella caledoniensis]QNO14619.1 nitrous oxide-stimulated promoter family protein [Alkalicella caledoniensis]